MKLIRSTLVLAVLAAGLSAHVGSPDVYLDGAAGPYKLFIAIRPPTAIPGIAELEIRTDANDVSTVKAAPLPMTGPGAKFAPTADVLKRSAQDAQFYTGSLWLMSSGAWQVRLTVDGARGKGVLSVPVPAVAQRTKNMQFGLGAILFGLMTFLVLGLVAIVGASVREAQLEPGVEPTDARKRRSRFIMLAAFVFVLGVVWLSNRWWNSEAEDYGAYIYKPLQIQASREGYNLLTLRLSDPGWLKSRRIDDLVPDHNHLMHLYAIRQPGLDVVYHLHPELVEPGLFKLALPAMPAGEYRLYADVVHQSGLSETPVTSITLPEIKGLPLAGDDATGSAAPISSATAQGHSFTLPDGYRMTWAGDNQDLVAKRPYSFRFQLLNPDGKAPSDMAFYMGMLGHAAFLKTDGSVFAHIHPIGSVSMAAFMIAQEQNTKAAASQPASNGESMSGPVTDDDEEDQSSLAPPQPAKSEMDSMPGMDHSMHHMAAASNLPNEVSFPYGFPTPGRYRIFVQMKHGDTVETGVFDADVK
jgi:hypothetical protein